MGKGGLTALQERILQLLADHPEGWTLVGGAALAGFYLYHRSTRDLDLIWRDRSTLENLPREVVAPLAEAALEVHTLQSAPAFHRLRVTDGEETCLVALVAEPIPPAAPPRRLSTGGATITVDDPHEILVAKLCALLGRAEVRDLIDCQALLASGGDLERALRDAPARDAGFSALTLAWILDQVNMHKAARAVGLEEPLAASLAAFKSELVERLLQLARGGA